VTSPTRFCAAPFAKGEFSFASLSYYKKHDFVSTHKQDKPDWFNKKESEANVNSPLAKGAAQKRVGDVTTAALHQIFYARTPFFALLIQKHKLLFTRTNFNKIKSFAFINLIEI